MRIVIFLRRVVLLMIPVNCPQNKSHSTIAKWDHKERGAEAPLNYFIKIYTPQIY
jgi:hypothetical protein